MTNSTVIHIAIAILWLFVLDMMMRRFTNYGWVIRYIKYKLEMKKKCLKTKPCQCCAYWNVRKEYCALEKQLQHKHSIFD